jgi:hypothetical protein
MSSEKLNGGTLLTPSNKVAGRRPGVAHGHSWSLNVAHGRPNSACHIPPKNGTQDQHKGRDCRLQTVDMCHTAPPVPVDPIRLGLLAETLETAGRSEEAILGHLRWPGPHFLDWHVLDALPGSI